MSTSEARRQHDTFEDVDRLIFLEVQKKTMETRIIIKLNKLISTQYLRVPR